VGEEWSVEDKTMSWEDYSRIFDILLADVVAEFDPQRDYWPCSPHSPLGNRDDYNNPK
jgi:beta-mannosidase